MRCADDPWMLDQRMPFPGRLLLKDIQGRPTDMTRLQGLQQRRLVNDASSGRVDDQHARLRFSQSRPVNQSGRILRFRDMNRNDVRSRQ